MAQHEKSIALGAQLMGLHGALGSKSDDFMGDWENEFSNANAELLDAIQASEPALRASLLSDAYALPMEELAGDLPFDRLRSLSFDDREGKVTEYGLMLAKITFCLRCLGAMKKGGLVLFVECKALIFAYKSYWKFGDDYLLGSIVERQLARIPDTAEWTRPEDAYFGGQELRRQLLHLGYKIGGALKELELFRKMAQLNGEDASSAPKKPEFRDFGAVLAQIRHAAMAVPRKNMTFTDGPDMHLNACVGDNTGGDSDFGYVKGFAQAVAILLSAAQREIYADPVTGEDEWAYMDALIYPIGFCARHHIELFLKRQIRMVESNRNKKPIVYKGHGLGKLWDALEAACSTDRRLAGKIAPMEEFVKDFEAIDSTGQTFRYQRKAKNGAKHLTDIGVINLQVLASRFKELDERAEEFEEYSAEIAREYSWGTYTSRLSRAELRELAEMLPDRSNWRGDEFKSAKQTYMEKYGLGSNDFTKAVDKILEHREFSAMVGVEIPLEHVAADVFERIKAFDPRSANPIEFSIEELAALYAINEVSRPGQYSEAYEHVLENSTSKDSERSLSVPDIVRLIRNHSDRFRGGLDKLGQKTLRVAFEELFPPTPPLSEAELRRARKQREVDLKEQMESIFPLKHRKRGRKK